VRAACARELCSTAVGEREVACLREARRVQSEMDVKRICVALACLAVSALAGTGHAEGGEPRGHSGAACRRGPGAGAVVCPIVRDSPYAPAAPLDVSVTVQSSGGSRLTCTFYSRGATGNLIAAFSKSTHSPTATPFFTVPPHYVGFAGSFSVACTLPPGGAVLHYYAGEAVGRDAP
jgi:hypothetical protein